ncbi:MAG: hypothetical protein GQ474_00555 [Sulfurimonas sp.]|nr:hypothetical protein [Sulfurimonas sp.]
MRDYRKEHLTLREEIVNYAGLENCIADGEDISEMTDLTPDELEAHTDSLVEELYALAKEMNVHRDDLDLMEVFTEESYNAHIDNAMANRHRGVLKITSMEGV